ncbi:MAG: hypothetical protein RSC56_03220 [Acidaminococcaceae bacterium]
MGVFFLFFGIGAVIGMLYAFIRYGIPLVALILVSIFDVLKVWKEAFTAGLNQKPYEPHK